MIHALSLDKRNEKSNEKLNYYSLFLNTVQVQGQMHSILPYVCLRKNPLKYFGGRMWRERGLMPEKKIMD